jgi:hypothetical protein
MITYVNYYAEGIIPRTIIGGERCALRRAQERSGKTRPSGSVARTAEDVPAQRKVRGQEPAPEMVADAGSGSLDPRGVQGRVLR